MGAVKKMVWYILLAAILYALIILLMYFNQARLIYYPTEDLDATPSDMGLKYEDIDLTTSDKVKLNAWFVPANDAKYTVLFCHGNGGNISHRLDIIALYNALNMNVFIFDYRGYGKSEGKPTEKGTYRDVDAAWNYLTNDMKIPAKSVIVLGRSLGGGVATYITLKKSPRALILESTFTSVPDMAKKYYAYLPVSIMPIYQYPNIDRIKEIKCPVLVMHSPDDGLVPYKHGERLYKTANEPKTFVKLKGSHNDGFFVSKDIYKSALERFVSSFQ